MSEEEVPFNDIPDAALQDASRLQDFLVPMFVTSSEKGHPPRLSMIGSGTLVEIDGSHNILTAAHVWNALNGMDLGLVLTTNYPSGFSMKAESLSAKVLWHGRKGRRDGEWGPDLALVRLHPSHVERINAHKVFLNLSRQRTEFLADPVPKLRVYAMTGMVDEWTRVDADAEEKISAVSQSRAFFSPLVRARHEREGYDYLDVAVNSKLPNVPQEFGGVSGGGLWEIGLTKTRSGPISWDGKRRFRGVAFWQQYPTPDKPGWIRCHGPHSVFATAWESWTLPAP